MQYYALGIDTSNYTTSIALVNQDRNLILDNRKLLDVKEGQRGLRQSEALFQHVINIPTLFHELETLSVKDKIRYISVSSRPRPREGSYMPVFCAARSYGQVLSSVLQCKYVEFSHQENHIEAAKWSINNKLDDKFIGVHISGGTTETLLIEKKNNLGYEISIVGGSSDISAGQLIDRIGVKLGYRFPAGKYLDETAMKEDTVLLNLPISVKNTFFNFSGLETKAYKLLEQYDADTVAKSIMHSAAKTFGYAILNACSETGLKQVLCLGGVASSQYIRKYLEMFANKNNFKIYFGDGKYCTDNAVGTALLALVQ